MFPAARAGVQGASKVEPESHAVSGWQATSNEAAAATRRETQMGFIASVKQHPKALFWSFAVSLVVIMDGYDTALIGTLQGFPAFKHRFGYVGKSNDYQVPPRWQTAIGMASPVGNIFGIFINSLVTERVGHKKMLLLSLVILTGFIFIQFFAKNIQQIFAGEILCGLPWGVFTTLAPAYASEVAPASLRAYLETYVVLCWGIGQLISYAVLDSLDSSLSQWAWRIPFGVQWVFPVVIFPLAIFCPESPWWLVRRGRIADAEKSVKRLTSWKDEQEVHDAVALMVETTELERSMTEGATYLDCFRGSNLWRTEISCCAWVSQVLVGFALTWYQAYFFEQAGLSTSKSYKLTVGQGGLNVFCTLLSCFVTHRFGRRTNFIAGCLMMATVMFIIGFLSIPTKSANIAAAQAAMYMLWFCLYLLTIGPTVFIIIGETSSTRLRSHTIALARNAYNVFGILSSATAPIILNPDADNWKGKSGFLAGGLGLICALWGFFRLPDCKGRTYEELDIMFSKNLKASQFKSYQIDRQQFISEKLAEVEVEHVE
ncbi:uncharacterized protein N7498_007937 [Penicillium cinerascens]|uniref:Major facilitator superfamily (MFS) profile domain-containing protein n=1 Tax=Penicillium cinerascens TaxID=70096 RepID=A0A9W9MAA9_9EURO|nr:uncharacterized protein N7498_007937 [Penicillium cinerascens]KAJ5194499.1 hypothetical protein N7498_007937 [Penicillium cinerascens]